jgi:hypothetical protein
MEAGQGMIEESANAQRLRELMDSKTFLAAESGAIAVEMETLAKEAAANPETAGLVTKMIVLADRIRRIHQALETIHIGPIARA